MNTSKYIPYESVSSITLINEEFKEHPVLSGTGFFVFFPPYDKVFFITARHCVKDVNNKFIGDLFIPYTNKNKNTNEIIKFSAYLETSYRDDPDGVIEDVIAYIVGDITEHQKNILKKRALRLQNQDDVDAILNSIHLGNGNIRMVGFPDVSKSIDYEVPSINLQARGFYAKISGKSEMTNCYCLAEGNWKEGSLSGFSGSPMISLHPTPNGSVIAIPVGIFLSEKIFISINVVTNLIAGYINNEVEEVIQK